MLLDHSETEKKGGETNEQKRITFVDAVAFLHGVCGYGDGSGTGIGLWENPKPSFCNGRLLPYDISGRTRQ
jgi:hypothetical protein